MSRGAKILLLVCVIGLAGLAHHYFSSAVEIANAPASGVDPSGPIIAFGDSLTEGFGAKPEESYPDQLVTLIGRPVINRGVSGDTVADALRRLDREVLSAKPVIVLVMLGGNDILQQKPIARTFDDLDKIVGRCIDSGAMVALIGVEGISLITGDYGSRYKELARRRKCLYVPNILHGIVTDPSLMSDQFHPNGKGYAVIAERIAKALKPYIKGG